MPHFERRICSGCGSGLGFTESDPCDKCEAEKDLTQVIEVVCIYTDFGDEHGKHWVKVETRRGKQPTGEAKLLHNEEIKFWDEASNNTFQNFIAGQSRMIEAMMTLALLKVKEWQDRGFEIVSVWNNDGEYGDGGVNIRMERVPK